MKLQKGRLVGKLKIHYELLNIAACGKPNVERKTKAVERITCTKCKKYVETNHITTQLQGKVFGCKV